MKTFRDRDWDPLLDQVVAGSVVPIVGTELIMITRDGGDLVPLEDYLRAGLTREYFDATSSAVQLTAAGSGPSLPLSRLCSDWRHLPNRRDDDCYYEANQLLLQAPPEPCLALQQLASITDFSLYVSTTPDDYLRRALRQARAADPLELIYSPRRRIPVLPDDLPPQGVVYKLFGKASNTSDYVLREEDHLEFISRLQNEPSQPVQLLELLGRSTLLILGSTYPDWLARFFFFSSQSRASGRFRGRAIVADGTTASDPGLCAFLERNNAEVWTGGDGAAFVAELHQRWQKHRLRSAPSPSIPTASPDDPPLDFAAAPRNAIFISYAREDAFAATQLAAALFARGLPVWLDKYRLESGDEYARKIRRSIDTASLFIPVLSSTTETLASRFFKREWTWALDQAEARYGSDFILPVLVGGEINYEEGPAATAFGRLHWEPCPGGQPTEEFLDSVARKYAALQRAGSGGTPGV